ncbi:hypothetical protein I6I76_11885 [Dermacoccus nishinomiyaensis]|uniref:zinc ABC transporter permease n=1 Tax=Dermacoccus nishinomiyaensis TaxID=1274 RepID=UPI000DFBA2F9|nr:zinc ABC transporter permease [Dermacoccus nishinomiyaensis]QQY24210.1 hypothetical protein I6I76_11885 [Dermacoccus nishinomiyaensis]STD71269.1 Lipid A core - O-antigen ligase and related enzymes [Dermacoccus nishinomiyaensis]
MSSVYSPAHEAARQALKEEQQTPIERRLDRVGKSVASWWGPIVVVDFLFGVSLIVVMWTFKAGFPGGVITAAAMVMYGAFRRALVRVKWGGILLLVMFGLLAFLAVESQHNGMPWLQRDFKFFLILLAAAVIATGRINVRSLIIGGMVGAILNVPVYYLHLTPDFYPPYLTGFYGDKNVAGMYYALWGCLGLSVLPKRWHRWWIAASFVLLFLTGSRTSLAAYGAGLAWMYLRPRTGVTFRLGLGAIGYFILKYLMENLSQSSAFGDRKGDDWFRHQIEEAMTAKTHVTPWYGLGLNQGKVLLGGVREAFFHNSYQQAFVEGGWPFLLIVIIAFMVIGLGIFDRRVVIPPVLLRLEGSVVVLLVCAWKLGEVFMTLGAFIILGMCMAHRLGVPRSIFRDAVPAHLQASSAQPLRAGSQVPATERAPRTYLQEQQDVDVPV